MSNFLMVLMFVQLNSAPVWTGDLEAAKAKASKEHKLIILNFSGSDWCIPCISMHKEIFDNAIFEHYSNDHLVLVNADFPRKKKNQLAHDQQQKNDVLAEIYNKDGSFPMTLLLDSNGRLLKKWEGYYRKGAESFVEEIEQVQK